DFNIAKAHDILKFVEVLDIIVNKNLLMDAGNRNINLTIEFNNLFDKYISKAGFDDIVETKVIDGGIKSLCESIFFISRLLFEIKEEGFFNFRESNTKIILEANSDELNNTKFIEAKQKIDRINKLLSQYINYQYSYGSSYFFKITEVAFTRSIKEIYGENDLKFTVSDDIMKLFLEPLYSANNPLNIALRELLQNSFDACKKVRLENGGFSEIIVDFFMEYNNLCEIYLSDNGLGMNLEDIRQHYLRVGKSSKSEDKSLGLIGRFGIGALANFLVGSTCDIVTKRSNDSMEYSFTIEKDDFNVKNLIGKKVNRFKESYTKIKIRADEELQKEYRIKEIVEELGIEKMLLNEDINLVFNFKNLNADGSNEVVETRKVHALNSYNLEFFSEIFLGNDSQAKVYIFDHIKYRSESEKSDFEDEKEKFKIISNHSGNILYNNQIGKVNFHTPIGRNNFYASNLPLIVVNGYVSPDEGYTPELSRNVYNIGSIFSTNIIKKRYEIGIPRVIDRIENINETSENPLNEIVALSNFAKDNSIVLPNIIFSKGQIELYVDKSDIDFKIYANELTPTQLESLNISEELRYTQQGILSDKSFVASVIEQQKSIVISRNFVDRFLIKANSSQNGFRRGALLSLLKSIGLEDLYQGKNLIEVWRKLDSSKEIIIRKLDDIEKNSLIPLTDDGSRLLEQMKGNNLKFPNLIISKNPTLSLPDEEFRKIYKECINNNNF
ncbi:hypothetical protein DW597_06060, partial [Enterococcus faecalis]|nr:hypothetical protein [Enterococcus faecalis]